ncbi:hypothetical protein V8C35DRAFT_300188 [Trichoderma chlorosporum]
MLPYSAFVRVICLLRGQEAAMYPWTLCEDPTAAAVQKPKAHITPTRLREIWHIGPCLLIVEEPGAKVSEESISYESPPSS